MKAILSGLVAALALSLAACGGSGSGGDDIPVRPINYTPSLYSFDMLDSYDVDSGFSDEHLHLNPYLYYGLFEVYWQAKSREDFRVTVRVNDAPEIAGSIIVHSEICGPGRWCDLDGSLICDYGADLTMSCDTSGRRVDIDELFIAIPDRLFMLLEVCDLDSPYCEFAWHAVWME